MHTPRPHNKLLSVATRAVTILAPFAATAAAECPYDWRPGTAAPPRLSDGARLIAWDPDGSGPLDEWLVAAGRFSHAGDLYVNNIAAWDGAGWRSFGSGLNERVTSLAVINDQLYASAWKSNPSNESSVFRWDGSAWQALPGPFNGIVYTLALFDSDLVAGGEFTTVGTLAALSLARWDGTTWHPIGGGTNGYVRALHNYKGDLVASGSFAAAGGTPANNIAVWNRQTWQQLFGGLTGEGVDGGGGFLDVIGNELMVAHGFNRFRAWDGASWRDLGFNLNFADPIEHMFAFNGALVIGGEDGAAQWDGQQWSLMELGGPDFVAFTRFRGRLVTSRARGEVASWNGTIWELLTRGPGFSDPVNAFTQYNGELIVGGDFTAIGDLSAAFVGAWNGSTWRPLGSGLERRILSLTTYKGELVAGGYTSTTADGSTGPNISAWDGTAWHPFPDGMVGVALAMTQYGDELIVGGDFVVPDDERANNLARWNGKDWLPLGEGLGGFSSFFIEVNALSTFRGELIVGGRFTTAGNIPATYIARWNGQNWQPLGDGTNGPVGAMAHYQGDLIVAGSFSFAGGSPARGVARWDGRDWHSFGDEWITALTTVNGELFATGSFSTAPDPQMLTIARWNATSWQPIQPGVAGFPLQGVQINAMIGYSSDVWLGGNFLTVGGQVSAYLASWGPALAAPAIAQQPTRETVVLAQPATFHVAATGGQPLAYQWRKNGETLTDTSNIGGSQTDTLTIASATQSDTGQYDCMITNECGNATSNPARLTVLIPMPGPPQTTTPQPANPD